MLHPDDAYDRDYGYQVGVNMPEAKIQYEAERQVEIERTIRDYAQLGIDLDRTMAQAVLAAEAHEEHRWDHLALLVDLAEQADDEEEG